MTSLAQSPLYTLAWHGISAAAHISLLSAAAFATPKMTYDDAMLEERLTYAAQILENAPATEAAENEKGERAPAPSGEEQDTPNTTDEHAAFGPPAPDDMFGRTPGHIERGNGNAGEFSCWSLGTSRIFGGMTTWDGDPTSLGDMSANPDLPFAPMSIRAADVAERKGPPAEAAQITATRLPVWVCPAGERGKAAIFCRMQAKEVPR